MVPLRCSGARYAIRQKLAQLALIKRPEVLAVHVQAPDGEGLPAHLQHRPTFGIGRHDKARRADPLVRRVGEERVATTAIARVGSRRLASATIRARSLPIRY